MPIEPAKMFPVGNGAVSYTHLGKTNPLKPEHFDDFIACYADGDLSKRKETYSEENQNGRWRKFSIQDIRARDKTSLDITWMKTESDTDNYTLAELLDQIKEKSQNIAKACLLYTSRCV